RLQEAQAVEEGDLWVPQTPDPGQPESSRAMTPNASLAVLPVLVPMVEPPGARDAAAASTGAAMDPGQAEAAALGQVVHKALEWLTTVPMPQRSASRLAQAISAACRAVDAPPTLGERALSVVTHILSSPDLSPWLDPDQLAWAGNEVSLIHAGRTLRLDRLVAKSTAAGREWWVLDYKLQHRPQDMPSYQTQMRQYVAAVSALQPGEVVKAAFMTGDGRLIEIAL
ncbi:MAG: PD-(D/E)XK nuclease family protein, partial [Pseudomonadota bacterium]